MRQRDIWPLVGVLGIVALMGWFIADYLQSEPVLLSAEIQDKQHIPGHYVSRCSTDEDGNYSCRNDWVPPVWEVLYTDEEGGHTVGVPRAVYYSLKAGQPVLVRFHRGAYTGIRYGTNFSPDIHAPVEKAW